MGEAVAVAARANVAPSRDWKCILTSILLAGLLELCEVEKRELDHNNRVDVEWMSFHCSRAVPAPAPGCRSAH
jgi:hypothetical protein